MKISYFLKSDCGICKSLERDKIMSRIREAYTVTKIIVDLPSARYSKLVRTWNKSPAQGRTPTLLVPNLRDPWIVGYDAIEAFADKCDKMPARELFPVSIPLALGAVN